MKLKKESTTLVIRNNYTVQFKEQVLARADRGSAFPQSTLIWELLSQCYINGDENFGKPINLLKRKIANKLSWLVLHEK